MSRRRLVVTTAVMAAVAVGLRGVTPDLAALTDGGLDLPRARAPTGREDPPRPAGGAPARRAARAAGLREAPPALAALTDGGLDLQRAVDTTGRETLLLSAVAAGAWLAWAWGALGLAATAPSAP